MKKTAALGLALALFTAPVFAHSYKLGSVEIGHIWARATAANAQTASIYVPLLNEDKEPDQFLGGSTPVADTVSIHESYEENGVSKMRALDNIELAPNKPVAMRPGGKHLMLTGLKKQLNEGDKFRIAFRFAKAGSIEVQVMVHAAGATSGAHH
jgi:periplasmic copper chaperone A